MGSVPSNILFVGNLPGQVDRKLLFELGCQAGPVLSVTIPQGDSGNKGYAFIEYEDVETATYAVKLFEGLVKMHGRVLRIAYGKASRSKPEPPALTPASQAAAAAAAAAEGRAAPAGHAAELAAPSPFDAPQQEQQQPHQQQQFTTPQLIDTRYNGANASPPATAAFEQQQRGVVPQAVWQAQPAGFGPPQPGTLLQQPSAMMQQQSGGYAVQQQGAFAPQLSGAYHPQYGSYQQQPIPMQQHQMMQQQQQYWGQH